jgi:hypothetical protein
MFDREGSEEEQTQIFKNCRIDINKRTILIVNRDTEEELLRCSRRDILKIVRLPVEEERT